MSGKITLDGLYKLGAGRSCPSVAKFAAMFPDGAELTEATYDRAVAAGLDAEWLGWWVLPDAALADYRRACGAAVKAAFAATYWAAKGGTE